MIRNGRMFAELLLPEVDRHAEELRELEANWGFAGATDGLNFFDDSEEDDGCLRIDDVVYQFMNRRNGTRWTRYIQNIDDARAKWKELTGRKQADAIWGFFDNRVDLASLSLFARSPDDFLLMRDLGFQDEVFGGLSLLAEDFPYLRLPFRRMSGVARSRYEQFNDAVQRLARDLWPDAGGRPARLMALVYRVLPELVRHRDGAFRAWVGVTAQRHNIKAILDPTEDEKNWSAVRRAQPRDLYFVYCASPVRAMRAVFNIAERPKCDPFGAWYGHWVDMDRRQLFTLSFAEMKADPVLGKWSAIRRQFQGITLEQILPAVYAHLRDLLVARGVDGATLPPVDVADFLTADDFESEKDFETRRIKPLLKELGFGRSLYQAECPFRVGSQVYHCRVDFLVKTPQGRVISLFENKKSTKGYRRLEDAYEQARSYALQLDTPSFVVAAAESLHLYARTRSKTDFLPVDEPSATFRWADLDDPKTKESLRRMLLAHAGLSR